MPRLSRFAAALFSLWVAALLGDPGVLHSCAMHGGGGSTPASHAHAGAHHMGRTGATHEPAPTAACSCIGECCVPAPAPMPATSVAWTSEVVVVAARTPDVATPPAPARANDLRLPFATAPPLA